MGTSKRLIKKSPKPNDIIVGRNVRRLRLLRSMSQEALGNALGLTFQQVQKYEKGTNRIGGSRLMQICDVLNCKITELFEGAVHGEVDVKNIPHDPFRQMGETQWGIRMATAFLKLHEGEQRAAAEFFEELGARHGRPSTGRRSD